ncbi:MAG: ATP-binding domain-containing protein [Bacilli bacterium]|nr:ATP-binding domain-containing protein [Bacilli bacterium]
MDRLYRQDENSYIPSLALEIKEGELSESFLETKSDYTFLQCGPASIKNNLKNLCKQIVDKGYNYKDIQVLAPMYKGENGIDLLNKELQDIFNPKTAEKREIKYGDVTFRENDKVLQLVNMPDDNVYNGDIGVIKYIKYGNTSKSGKNEIYVDFDGNVVKYGPKDFVKIKHGFIISIHKSQGSEFKIVVMPITNAYYRMLYRKLIYTGVTRAKKKLIMVGEAMAFVSSVRNNNEYGRNSKLLDKLVYKFNN